MISAAICGLGRWGQALVTAVQGKSDRIRFAGGVVRDTGRTRDFASQHGLALTTTLAEAAGDPGVDAVFLATPHSLRAFRKVSTRGPPRFPYVQNWRIVSRISPRCSCSARRPPPSPGLTTPDLA
jgi:hypothetical protein